MIMEDCMVCYGHHAFSFFPTRFLYPSCLDSHSGIDDHSALVPCNLTMDDHGTYVNSQEKATHLPLSH